MIRQCNDITNLKDQINDMKNGIYSIFDQLVISGSFFVYNLILVSAVGLPAYGEFSLLWMCYIFSIGIQNSMIIHHLQIEDEDKVYVLFSLNLLLSVLCASVIFVVNKLYFEPSYSDGILFLFSVFVLAQLNLEFLRRWYYKKNQENRSFYLSLYLNIIRVSILAVYFDGGFSVRTYIFALSMASLATTVLYLGKISCVRNNLSLTFKSITYYLAGSRWLLITSISQFFSGNYVLILSSSMIGLSALGAIRAFQNLVGPLQVMFQVAESYFPRLVLQNINSTYTRARIRYNTIVFLSLAFVSMLCLSAYFLLPLVIDYFSLKNLEDVLIAEMLIFVYVLIFINQNIKMYLRLNKITSSLFVAEFLCVCFSLFVAHYIIEAGGFNGLIASLYAIQIVAFLALIGPLYRLLRSNQ